MLSIKAITRSLGRDILIYPFDPSNLKGVGYNLSVSRFGWSLSTRDALETNEQENAFSVEPGDTALVLTAETIGVSKRVGGTIHSKVKRVSEGFSHVSTTLDPMWVGPLLIAVTNTTNRPLLLKKGKSIATAVFYRVQKASEPPGRNLAGRIGILQHIGVRIGRDCSEWLDEEHHKSLGALKVKMRSQDALREIKGKTWLARLYREHLLPGFPFIVALVLTVSLGRRDSEIMIPLVGLTVTMLAVYISKLVER